MFKYTKLIPNTLLLLVLPAWDVSVHDTDTFILCLRGMHSISHSTCLIATTLAIALLGCTGRPGKEGHDDSTPSAPSTTYRAKDASEFLGRWTGTMGFSVTGIPPSVAREHFPDSLIRIAVQVQGIPENDSVFIFFFYADEGKLLFGLPAYFADGKMQFDSEKSHDIDKLMALMMTLMTNSRNLKSMKFYAIKTSSHAMHYALHTDAVKYQDGKKQNISLDIKGHLEREKDGD